jgi:hypothetical protein
MLFAGIPAVTMLTMAPAFACTSFVGSLTLSGNGVSSVNTTFKGDGGGGMGWCSSPSTDGTDLTTNNSSTFSIDTEAISGVTGCSNSQMPSGNAYYVGIQGPISPTTTSFPSGSLDGCAGPHGGTDAATVDKHFSIDSTGHGNASYSVPSVLSTTGEWDICVFVNQTNGTPDAIGGLFYATSS